MGGAFRNVVIAAILLCSSAAAAEEFYGPLRIRDMGPFQMLRLNMMPDHAIAPSRGRFALEFHLSHSNTFVMDKDMHDYLAERDRRAGIEPGDVSNLRARSSDTFLFDGELGYFQLTAHYGLSDRWSAYLSVPAHYYGGGYMDGTIESFHGNFGFDTYGREYINRNSFQALVIVDGDVFYLPKRPLKNGLGDPVIGARYYYPLRDHSAMTIEFAHKVAAQGEGSFRSTGSDDTGLQASWRTHGVNNSFYVSGAVVWTGRAQPFPDKTRRAAPSLNVAWERRLGQHVNLVAQLNMARSVFRDGADPELTGNVYQASLGLRQRRGAFVWSYALTENLVNFNNSADLGFHIGFAWLPQAAQVD